MTIKPLGNRVLAKQIEAETKTASGIIIPDSAQEKPLQAEIVAVGKEVTEVSVGEKVIYAKYKGTELTHNNETYILLEVEDLLATI